MRKVLFLSFAVLFFVVGFFEMKTALSSSEPMLHVVVSICDFAMVAVNAYSAGEIAGRDSAAKNLDLDPDEVI